MMVNFLAHIMICLLNASINPNLDGKKRTNFPTFFNLFKSEFFISYWFRYSFICQGISTVKRFVKETVKGPFWSSSQAATYYYQSNYLKVEAIPLSALPKDTKSELAGLLPH